MDSAQRFSFTEGFDAFGLPDALPLLPLTLAYQSTTAEQNRMIQERRAYYQNCYQHYAPQVLMKPEQKDLMIAGRALQQGHSPQGTVYILANGDPAQKIKQEQGKQEALAYARALTQQATQQQEKTLSQSRDLER